MKTACPRRSNLTALLAFALTLGTSTICLAWVETLDGDPTTDEAWEIVVHPDGHVYAVGTLGDEIVVVKRVAATGVAVWTRSLARPSSEGRAIAIAPDGGLVVGGSLTADVSSRWFLAKLNQQGTLLWSQLPPESRSRVIDLDVDEEGDVVAVGSLDGEFVARKVGGASGLLIWQRQIVSPSPDITFGNRVKIDSAGHPIIAAELPDTVAMKLSGANGSTLWMTANLNAQINGLQLDSSDNAIVLRRNTIYKFAGASGGELWQRVLEVGLSSIAVNSVNDVVGCGDRFDTNQFVASVAHRINGVTGGLLWTQTSSNRGSRITTDASDDVYVGGGGDGAVDFRKLVGSSGGQLWTKTLTGTDPMGFAAVWSLASEGGFLYAGGILSNLGTGRDHAMLRLDASDGSAGDECLRPFCDLLLIPIWDNPLLWVFGYDIRAEIIEQIEELIETDPALEDALLTQNALALVLRPDDLVILAPAAPAGEILAVAVAIAFRDEIFSNRTVPAVMLFENGGIGQLLIEIAIRVGRWGPR